MPASMEFSFQFRAGPGAARIEPEQAMKLLLLADFSAESEATVPPLAQRRPRLVDIDNLDQVMQAFAPRLLLDLPELGQAQLALQFHTLEDFTPDHLYRNLPLFQSLRETREQLQHPATFAAAVAKLNLASPLIAAPAATPAPASAPAATPEVSDFAALLGGNVRSAASNPTQGDSFAALIHSLAAPHIVAAHDASQYLAMVDDVGASLMRAILHHPAFQALEAAWRGVHFLITNLELDESLQLHLLQASKAELAQDVQAAGGDLQQAALYRLLVEAPRQAADGTPWACWIGDYTFDASDADVAQLAALGALAAQAGAPFLAAGAASIAGCSSLTQAGEPRDWPPLQEQAAARWQTLRTSPQAPWLGLALPRLLLRLPYGKNYERVDAFAFEEHAAQHEHFLWGNAALACGLLLAQAYQQEQWQMQPGDVLEIGEMPAYTLKVDGESQMQAGAEVYLLERAAQSFSQCGLMVLQSYKNRNAVRLLRFQSLALPQQSLAGAWQA